MTSVEDLLWNIPHEEHCTLCGLPFWLYSNPPRGDSSDRPDDDSWIGYHLFLRIRKCATTGPDSGGCIAGVGQWDPREAWIPPPGYDIRNVLRGRPPRSSLRDIMNADEKAEWEGFEPIYPLLGAMDGCVKAVYLMHPCCWDILVQQHALLAPPTEKLLDLDELARVFLQIPLGCGNGGFRPDWATDYAGSEQFWWTGEEDNFIPAREWHWLLHDPGVTSGFDNLLANPPLESAANTSPRIQFTNDGRDIFGSLPEEILIEILVLLPSPSVRDLQLASRKMASVHLSSRYWRSRFDWPNELYHVELPQTLRNSGQVGEQWVDWRRLCDQLLHPVGEQFGWWQNRKRITTLNRKLVESMSCRGSDGRLKEVEGGASLLWCVTERT